MQADNNENGDGTTTPSGSRKNSKPIMEKRRRARINNSLAELKSLLLEVLKKEGTRHNKMEKADILEMTVRHLRQIQRRQFAAAACVDAGVLSKYQNGFKECAEEVSRYLSNVEGIDTDTRVRLLNHLANSIANGVGQCVTHAQTAGPVTAHVRPIQTHAPQQEATLCVTSTKASAEINNNITSTNQQSPPFIHSPTQTKSADGINLVPQPLAGGDVAFVIPSNILASGHVPGYVIPIYASTQVSSPQFRVQTAPMVSQNSSIISPANLATPLSSRVQEVTSSRFLGVADDNRGKPSSILLLQSQGEHRSGGAVVQDTNDNDKDKCVNQNVDNSPQNNADINVNAEEVWRPW